MLYLSQAAQWRQSSIAPGLELLPPGLCSVWYAVLMSVGVWVHTGVPYTRNHSVQAHTREQSVLFFPLQGHESDPAYVSDGLLQPGSCQSAKQEASFNSAAHCGLSMPGMWWELSMCLLMQATGAESQEGCCRSVLDPPTGKEIT